MVSRDHQNYDQKTLSSMKLSKFANYRDILTEFNELSWGCLDCPPEFPSKPPDPPCRNGGRRRLHNGHPSDDMGADGHLRPNCKRCYDGWELSELTGRRTRPREENSTYISRIASRTSRKTVTHSAGHWYRGARPSRQSVRYLPVLETVPMTEHIVCYKIRTFVTVIDRARGRSRGRRTDRIYWPGRCGLRALSPPAVAGLVWNQ